MTPRHSGAMSGWSSDSSPDSCIRNNAASRQPAHPAFRYILRHLQDTIVPLIPNNCSSPPPEFPSTMLAFHLLTHAQIDSLARAFHQVWPPTPETSQYPVQIPPWVGTPDEHTLDLYTKRRRFGFFIGLSDCRTPMQPGGLNTPGLQRQEGANTQLAQTPSSLVRDFLESIGSDADSETVWQMLLGMEREWEDALARSRARRVTWTGPKSLFWDGW